MCGRMLEIYSSRPQGPFPVSVRLGSQPNLVAIRTRRTAIGLAATFQRIRLIPFRPEIWMVPWTTLGTAERD